MSCIWDLHNGRLVQAIPGGQAYAKVVFGPGNSVSQVRYDKEGEEVKKAVRRYVTTWENYRRSNDGRWLAVASHNSFGQDREETLSLWDLAEDKLLWKRNMGVGMTYYQMEFAPDGLTLAISLNDDRGRIKPSFSLCDTQTGKVRHVLDSASSGSCAFSGDSRRILLFTDAGLRVFDVTSGRLLHTLRNAREYTGRMTLSYDGSLLAGFDAKGKLGLCSVANDRVLVQWVALMEEPRGSRSATEKMASPSWLVSTPDGFYDASPGIERFLRWRVGERLYPASKFAPQFHRPDLVQQALQAP
jgi:WD40 repeat protein